MGAKQSDTYAPSLAGVAASVWSLLTPLQITARQPTVVATPYAGPRRGIAPLADVYLPDTPGPHPSVILVHGGGFMIGARDMKPMRYLATRFVDAGFAVMALDYRMVGRGGRLPEMVEDVRQGIDWWLSRCDDFQLDRAQVEVMGLSAGATLTMLAAGTPDAPALRRLISIFGVFDFSRVHGWHGKLWERLVLPERGQQACIDYSPITRCTTKTPLLIVHGTADTLIPHGEAERMARWRQESGLPVELVTLTGAPHAFFNDLRLPFAEQTLRVILSSPQADGRLVEDVAARHG